MGGTGSPTSSPPRHQHGLPPKAVGERSGREIGEGPGDPKGNDKGQCGDETGKPEDVGREERWHRPFLAHHSPTSAHCDQQPELACVRARPEDRPQPPRRP